MLCPQCGTNNEPGATNCKNCGVQFAKNSTAKVDKPNVAINIISLCCIPILGIIMFFVWRDTQPQAAKSALVFGLIGFGLIIASYILLGILGGLSAVFMS